MLDMGIPGVCNKWLTLPPNPDIVDIDLLYDVAGAGGHKAVRSHMPPLLSVLALLHIT